MMMIETKKKLEKQGSSNKNNIRIMVNNQMTSFGDDNFSLSLSLFFSNFSDQISKNSFCVIE